MTMYAAITSFIDKQPIANYANAVQAHLPTSETNEI